MLNRYSYKGCMFECRLNNAIDEVNCVPWDYPIPPKQHGSEMCTSSIAQNGTSKLARFEDFMNSKESIDGCNCLPDCEEVVYDAQVSEDTNGSNTVDSFDAFPYRWIPRK